MAIGDLELSPAFEKTTLSYTATTENEKDKITATVDDPTAKIKIVLTNSENTEGKTITNKTNITWASGEENTVTITVTDYDKEGDDPVVTTYTVVVTHSSNNSSASDA